MKLGSRETPVVSASQNVLTLVAETSVQADSVPVPTITLKISQKGVGDTLKGV